MVRKGETKILYCWWDIEIGCNDGVKKEGNKVLRKGNDTKIL